MLVTALGIIKSSVSLYIVTIPIRPLAKSSLPQKYGILMIPINSCPSSKIRIYSFMHSISPPWLITLIDKS